MPQARVQGLETEVQDLRKQLQAMQLDRTNQQAQLDQLSRVALRNVAPEAPPPPAGPKTVCRGCNAYCYGLFDSLRPRPWTCMTGELYVARHVLSGQRPSSPRESPSTGLHALHGTP